MGSEGVRVCDWPPPGSVMHVRRQEMRFSSDMSAATPCSANVTPVQLDALVLLLPTWDSLQ